MVKKKTHRRQNENGLLGSKLVLDPFFLAENHFTVVHLEFKFTSRYIFLLNKDMTFHEGK